MKNLFVYRFLATASHLTLYPHMLLAALEILVVGGFNFCFCHKEGCFWASIETSLEALLVNERYFFQFYMRTTD